MLENGIYARKTFDQVFVRKYSTGRQLLLYEFTFFYRFVKMSYTILTAATIAKICVYFPKGFASPFPEYRGEE